MLKVNHFNWLEHLGSSLLHGLAGGFLTGCSSNPSSDQLKPILGTVVKDILKSTCPDLPNLTPKRQNLGSVWFKPKVIQVHYRNHFRFYDLNPADGQETPETFLGPSVHSRSMENVLLTGLEKSLPQKISREITLGFPIRSSLASPCEAEKAVAMHQAGTRWARETEAQFRKVFLGDPTLQAELNNLNELRFSIRDSKGKQIKGRFFAYPQGGGPGLEDIKIHQLIIEGDSASLVLEGDKNLEPYLAKAKEIYLPLARSHIKSSKSLR